MSAGTVTHDGSLARERFVQANGLTHHVVEWGDPNARDVIVLCHGFLDLAWGFLSLAPRLAAEGFRAVAIDFRGHGESDRASASGYYYFPDYMLDLSQLIPQLVDGPYHLLGHSMGGTVCSWFASTAPSMLRTLTLIEGLGVNQEPAARAAERLRGWLDAVPKARVASPTHLENLEAAFERLRARHAKVDANFLRTLAEKSTCPHPSGDGLTWRFDPLHRTWSPTSFHRDAFVHGLSQIAVPTLVVQGERGMRTHDDAERIAAIPQVRREVVADAGHMVHWSHVDQVSALLLAHLRSA